MTTTAQQKGFPVNHMGSARKSPERAYPISSVDNALRVLLLFRETPELRLSDVAELVQVSPSTANRLLAALGRHDFVQQRGERGAYLAGPALLEIGYGAVRSIDLRSMAQPILDQLAESLDETVHLAQLEGGHIRYIAGAESTRALRVADRTGQLFPAHQTATGKTILAGLTKPQLREVLAGAAGTDDGTVAPAAVDKLEQELADVHAAGYALNHRPDGVVSVAVAVRNRRGLTVAAINASGPESRMPPQRRDEVVSILRSAADELGNALGAV